MAKKNSEFVDLGALFKTYLSKWYWFVISVALCVLFAWAYTRKFPQKMAIKANILIEQEDSSPLSALSGGMGSLFGSNGKVDDEIFVISSHSLYKNVVKELGLNRVHMVRDGFLKSHLAYPEFPIDIIAPGVADTLSRPVTFIIKVNKEGRADVKVKVKGKTIQKTENLELPAQIKTSWGEYAIVTTPTYRRGKDLKTTIIFKSYDGATEDLDEDVYADIASKKGNVINLGINHVNAEYGMDILNKIIEKYNERGIYEKNLQGQKTATFLEERINLLAGDLKKSETDIQSYKESNGIYDVIAEAKYQTEKKGEVESAIIGVEQQIALLKLTQDFLSDTTNYTELIPVTVIGMAPTMGSSSDKDAAFHEGISAYNELVLKRAEMSHNAKPNSYAIQQINKQMNMLRNNILQSSRQALRNANVSLQELKAERGLATSKLGQIPRQEREYFDLRRQQEIKQEIYIFLLEKQEENAMLLANSIPKGHLVDEAFTLTEPLGLSKIVIFIIAAVMGLFFPPVLIYIFKLIRSKFESREEVESRISAPIMGEMCIDKSGRNLVVSPTDTSSATELFRLMRANLLFMLNGDSDKVVLLTSTRSGEGKTFISINLAATLSLLEGKRVLLVGMDIRNPQLENYMDIDPPLGLTNYLSSSQVTLESIITPMPGIANCDVIVAGPIPPNPAEMLASSKVDELFKTLRGMYDFIVVDSAPVGMVSDTFTLNRIADAVIYVTRVNYSSMSDLRYIEEIYQEHRLKKLSVVVNGVKTKAGYGYGYGRKSTKS